VLLQAFEFAAHAEELPYIPLLLVIEHPEDMTVVFFKTAVIRLQLAIEELPEFFFEIGELPFAI